MDRRDFLKGGLALLAAALLPDIPTLPGPTNPSLAQMGVAAREGTLLGHVVFWDGKGWRTLEGFGGLPEFPMYGPQGGETDLKDAEVVVTTGEENGMNVWRTADDRIWKSTPANRHGEVTFTVTAGEIL